MMQKLDISAIVGLTIFLILIISIIILERKLIWIQLRYFRNKKKIIYLFLIYILNRSNKSGQKILDDFFNRNSRFIIPTYINNTLGFNFWESIYNQYPEILKITLDKQIDESKSIEYFDNLLYGQLKESLNSNFDTTIISKILAQAIIWNNPNKRDNQHASRLGSIAISLKLVFPPQIREESNKKYWNNLLGPNIEKNLNVKYIYKAPFHADNSKNFKVKSVYNSGVKIYKFFKGIKFTKGIEYVFKELNIEKFKPYFSQKDFD